MPVIAVLNSKGGVGRTTLATNLAGGLSDLGKKTLLVDSDPQRSSVDWRDCLQEQWPDAPDVVSLTTLQKLKEIKHRKRKYDFVVVDGAARLERLALGAVRVSDLVLMPIRPSAMDLWAVAPLIKVIQQHQQCLQEDYGGIKSISAAFVVSQQTGESLLAKEIAGDAAEMGFPVLKSRTTHRVIYAVAAQRGLTVQRVAPDSRAAAEVSALVQEVLNLVTPTPIFMTSQSQSGSLSSARKGGQSIKTNIRIPVQLRDEIKIFTLRKNIFFRVFIQSVLDGWVTRHFGGKDVEKVWEDVKITPFAKEKYGEVKGRHTGITMYKETHEALKFLAYAHRTTMRAICLGILREWAEEHIPEIDIHIPPAGNQET